MHYSSKRRIDTKREICLIAFRSLLKTNVYVNCDNVLTLEVRKRFKNWLYGSL